MAEVAVAAAMALIEKVLSSLSPQKKNQKAVWHQVEDLRYCLETLHSRVKNIDGNEGTEHLRERVKEVREVANQIEDVLEQFLYRGPFHKRSKSNQYDELAFAAKLWIPLSSLHEAVSKITDVKWMIDRILSLDDRGSTKSYSRMKEGSTFGSKPDNQVAPTKSNSRMKEGSTFGAKPDNQVAPDIPGDEEIVGFEELGEALTRQVTDQESRNITISVVGPGGSGKTTIVNKVYKIICRLFDCRAWVHVSDSFNEEELFRSMLEQFCESRKEPIPSEGTETHGKLTYYLQQKRYVLVLDDIWTKKHWEWIHEVLPRDSSGSRIIVTTRNSDVASLCAKSADFIHNLNGLKWPADWDLFCKKAFQTENGKCPPELKDLSLKIVKRCEGLPLAIVVIGSLLSKKQKFPLEWKKALSLGFEIGTPSDLSTISKILLPSYTYLPTHLKSCFLYFCIFPEDYSIDRGAIVRLWIAEGFVSKIQGKTLEEVAEYYLNDLIERNLVHNSRWDFDGQARSCRVHYLVHEFIVRKSEEVNFFSLIDELDASSSKKVRRFSIDYDSITLSQIRDLQLTYVRSAFLFKRSNVSTSAIESILRAFELVRVLDLRDAPLDKFPEAIILLTLLRYLCLRNTMIKEIPNSIKKLSYLETLDLKQTKVTTLPKGILQLRNLRHLLVYWYNIENYVKWDLAVGVKIARGIGALRNLQKLSLIKSDKHHEIVKDLGALIQLRKLGLVDLKTEDGKYLCKSVEKMVDLSTLDVSSTNEEESLDLDDMQSPPQYLQRLYLKGHLRQFPRWISKLDNLSRIGLKWSRLQNSPLDALQELPNLLELEMVDAFTGGQLVFKAGRFQKLKILHIEQFEQLDTVVVEEGAMPVLQKLSLCKCVKLKMLPLGIDKLTLIEKLEPYDMPVEFTNRLQKTHEDSWMVRHIKSIQSFVLQADGSWSVQENLPVRRNTPPGNQNEGTRLIPALTCLKDS